MEIIKTNQDTNSLHTSSSLRKYNRCPKLWYYYHKALVNPPYPMTDNKNIAYGSCFHQCMEIIMLNKLNGTTIDWKDKLATYDEGIQTMVTIMVDAAIEYDDFLNSVKPLLVEEEIYTTYDNVNLGGKIDCIGEYEGDTWVIDYKTSSRNAYEKRYQLDIQMSIYQYLAQSRGYKPKGAIVYHVRVPTLKQRKNESSDEFYDRVKNDILQQTIFPDSRRTTYFNIMKYEKSQELVNESLLDIRSTIYMIEQEEEWGKLNGSEGDRVIYRRNTSACFDFMKPCEFYDVCSGSISEKGLEKSESEHPELSMTIY